MENHYSNLKDYIIQDHVYSYYQEHQDMKLNDYEKYCINHIEDIKWALKEIDFLNNLIKGITTSHEN